MLDRRNGEYDAHSRTAKERRETLTFRKIDPDDVILERLTADFAKLLKQRLDLLEENLRMEKKLQELHKDLEEFPKLVAEAKEELARIRAAIASPVDFSAKLFDTEQLPAFLPE